MGQVSLTINLGLVDKASGAFARFGNNAASALGRVEQSLKAADAAGAKFQRTNQLLNQAALGVGVAMAGFGMGLRSAYTSAAEFDQQMRNVNSIAKLSEDQFRGLSGAVRELASDTKVQDSSSALAAGLYDIYSSGLQGESALAALEQSSKGASAGMTDTATASRVLVAAMNAYGQKGPADAAHFMDVMFKTVERGVVTFPELAGQLGDVLGIAAQLGVPIEALGAAIATMTKQGIGAAESTTSLNRILTEFLTPSKLMKEAIADSGYESGLALLKAKGLAGAMQWLTEVTKGDTSQMAAMLGEVRAVRGAMALTGNGAQIFADDLEGMEHAAGSMGAALEEQSKGPVFRARVAAKQFGEAMTSAGQSVKDAFGSIAPVLTLALKGFQAIADNPVGRVLIGIGTVVLGLGLVLASLVIALGKAVISWKMLTAAMAENAAQAAATAAANAGAGGAAAAGSGGGLLGKAGGLFGKAGPMLKGAVVRLAAFVAPIGAALASLWAMVAPVLAGIGTAIAGIAGAIAALPVGTILAIVAAIAAVGVGIWALVKNWSSVKTWFAGLGRGIASGLSSAWEAVSQWVAGAGAALLKYFSDLPANLGNSLGGAWSAVKYGVGYIIGAIGALPGAVQAALGRAMDTVKTWAVELPGRISSGLSSAYTAVVQWTQDTWKAIADFAASVPGRIAAAFIAFSVAVRDGLVGAWYAVMDFFAGLWRYLTELPGRMWQAAKDGLAGFVRGFKGGDASGGSNEVASGMAAGAKAFGGARATGGPVDAKRAYIIGERGPELFIPRENGTIEDAERTRLLLKMKRPQLTTHAAFTPTMPPVAPTGGGGSIMAGSGLAAQSLGTVTVEFVGSRLEQYIMDVVAQGQTRVVRRFR